MTNTKKYKINDRDKLITKNYTIENFTITSDNISNFKIIPSRRQISEVHVSKIHGVLLNNKNPVGVLIINKKLKETRLIDGNHRIEAVKRFYGYKQSFKEIKIECILKVYHDLTEEEEREVYSDEARRRNESYEDRLNIYKDTITFWKLLTDDLNKFPCKVTIYPAKESLKLRLLLNALNTQKNSTQKGYYPKYLNKENLILFAHNLNYDDFLLVKNFVEMFQEMYGRVGQSNIWTRIQFFIPLFDIYCRNIQYRQDNNFKERFTRILGRSDLINYSNIAGREAQSRIRSIMLEHMNHYISKNLFV